MKRFIVTGAAGFIGYRLAQSLSVQGHEVIAVDQDEHFKSRTEHTQNPWKKTIDRDVFLTQFPAEKIDGVYHLGACTRTTELDEDYLNKINLEYSKSLWKMCAEKKIPLVYASSAATYGAGEHGYQDDESQMGKLKPLNPYGDSKLRFDIWVLAQEQAGHAGPPSWSGFKFFNVYGFGERHKASMASVILHAFDQIHQKGEVKLFESHKTGIAHGHQKRDFICVEDLVDVLQWAMNKPLARGIFNLGTGQARTFLDLVKATFHALGKPEKITFIPTPEALRERYQYFTEADMAKLRHAGYSKPFTSLEQGVSHYVKLLENRRISG